MKVSDPATSQTLQGTRAILIAIALLALAIMLWKLSEVAALTFGGIVGAAMLRGLALPLGRLSGLSEKWSLSIVITVLVVLAGVFAWLFGTQVADQAKEMGKLIPQAVQQLTDSLNQSQAGQTAVKKTKEALADSKMFSGVSLAAGSVMFSIADFLLVFFLSIYFAFDPLEYLNGCVRLLPVNQRQRVKEAMLAAGEALRRWLLAQLIAMAIVGILVGVTLSIMKVPLAFLLGALAGLLEFIPVVGALLFSIPGILIAFTQGPTMAFYVLLAYLAIQQVESNIIIPLLQRWAVRLPPALTLISVVVGGVLLSAPGLVFASPLAVVAMTLVKKLYVQETLEHEKSPRPRPTVSA